ncbi:unnamed protein product [Blepharisma stoltei]|uniref:ADP-ribosylglycohydrolase n=1 Tax=Blepharisma stoltei TaxID=1481888 RepID=A0AAU9JAL6_9CILI|nr:unnamed protein product [Blepharisma stoltei]
MEQSTSEILRRHISVILPYSREELIDKIRGCIFGQAIGDAIGIRTECKSSEWAASKWENQPLTLLNWVPKKSYFPEGDWSDDTDQLVAIINSYLDSNGFSTLDFAAKIRDWKRHGFPELGDKRGLGIGKTVKKAILHKSFISNPHRAALEVWVNGSCEIAANGALMRSAILGIINFHDIDQVIRQTQMIGKCTHADPRSLASSVAQTVAIALMLQGVRNIDEVIGASCEIAQNFLKSYREGLDREVHATCSPEISQEYDKNRMRVRKLFKRSFLRKYMHIGLDEMRPIDGKNMGYVYFALGCGFYGIRQNNYEEMIRSIIIEGGDADTNAAIAGALLGCKLGFSRLPSRFVQELRYRDWLETKLNRVIDKILS